MSIVTRFDGDTSGLDKAVKDVGKSLNSIKAPAANANNALFSLTQVTRDLPFGFIAIQNNIPLVFDTFGQLTKEAGGVGNALKSLKTSLIGPGGISFAISVVISTLTALVQKYGSLGNAIDALFGKNKDLNEEVKKANDNYKEYNKTKKTSVDLTKEESAAVEGSISKVKALGKIVLDQKKSFAERNQALNSLKEINKDYFGNLDIEKTKYEDLKIAIKNYSKSLKETAVIKGFQEEISKSSVELSKQEKVAERLNKELDKVKRKPQKIVGIEARVDDRELRKAQKAFIEQEKIVKKLKTDIADYEKEIEKVVNQQNKSKVETEAVNKQLTKLKPLTKDVINENERLRKQGISDEINRQKDAWKAIGQAANEYYQTQKTIISSNDRIAKSKADQQQKQAILNTKKALDQQAKSAKEAEAAFFALADIEMQQDATQFNPLKGFETLAQDLQKYTNFQNVLSGLTTTFFDPLSSLFENFLTTGKFTFQDFAKTVLATVKRLVAQLIATGILRLLASILVPGGAQAGQVLSGAAKATKGIGGFLKGVLGGFLGGGVAAPQFGGVQAGALSMGGQVNLSLRGADLVGSINRTNTLINRIG